MADNKIVIANEPDFKEGGTIIEITWEYLISKIITEQLLRSDESLRGIVATNAGLKIHVKIN